jgi:hypothetical protein
MKDNKTIKTVFQICNSIIHFWLKLLAINDERKFIDLLFMTTNVISSINDLILTRFSNISIVLKLIIHTYLHIIFFFFSYNLI